MNTLVRFDPFSLTRDLDRLLGEFSRSVGSAPWVPRVDVFERENALGIRAELAGLDPDSLDVTVENGTLVISGSRSFGDEDSAFQRKEILEGQFRRTILLPEGLTTDDITADYQDGMLQVTIPKSPEVLPRKVQVQVNR